MKKDSLRRWRFRVTYIKISRLGGFILAFFFLATGCAPISEDAEREVAPVVTSVPATVPAEDRVAKAVSAPAPKPPSTPTVKPKPVPLPEDKLSIATEDYPRASRMVELLRIENASLDQEGGGYYMDVQFANLQQKLQESISVLSRYEDKISIYLPEVASFDSSGAQISLAGEEALSVIAKILNEYDKTLVVIEGFTRQEGDAEFRKLLAEKMSLSVGAYLSEHDVMFPRLLIIGLSKDSAVRQMENGGVELILEPITESSP